MQEPQNSRHQVFCATSEDSSRYPSAEPGCVPAVRGRCSMSKADDRYATHFQLLSDRLTVAFLDTGTLRLCTGAATLELHPSELEALLSFLRNPPRAG